MSFVILKLASALFLSYFMSCLLIKLFKIVLQKLQKKEFSIIIILLLLLLYYYYYYYFYYLLLLELQNYTKVPLIRPPMGPTQSGLNNESVLIASRS